MPRQNGPLIDSAIGKESICRLGVTPILASQGDGLAESTGQLTGEAAESPPETSVAETAASQFFIERCYSACQGITRSAQGLLKQFDKLLFWHLAVPFYTSTSHAAPVARYLWVIERLAIR
jgi:hypothetical protein